MTEPLRWGILGAARIAQTAVAGAIHGAQGAQLTALATTDPARAVWFAAQVPGLKLLTDYDALLADPQIDAVYIPLPNHMHVHWTEAALHAGKHVLCEKPIALKASDIDRLVTVRNATGRHVEEAFMVLHHPQWARARALLADGAIGTLVHVEGVFTYHNTDPANIRNQPEAGGGGLRDVGVYPCITTRFATNEEPTSIRADIRFEGGVDTFARVWADFPGFTMSFHCGMRAVRRQDMVFHGSTGWMRLTAPFNPGPMGEAQIVLHRENGNLMTERFPHADQYRAMIEAFGDAALGRTPEVCPLEFSRGNQVMIDAILAAER